MVPSEYVLRQSKSTFSNFLDKVDWQWTKCERGFDVKAVGFALNTVALDREGMVGCRGNGAVRVADNRSHSGSHALEVFAPACNNLRLSAIRDD